jgi:predicted ATPase
MLYEAYQQFGIRFIIETHSEYLLRKSQNIVLLNQSNSNSQVSENPFGVYYFNGDKEPYQMRYRNDGKFDRKFGSGFFDESDRLVDEMYELNSKYKS